jgi:hypothetical protein
MKEKEGEEDREKKVQGGTLEAVLRIQTHLIRIRILLFTLIRIRIRLFDTDPKPCHFKEVMNLKRYFLYIFTSFSLPVGPTGPTQKVFFVQFSLPVNFFVLMRVAYGFGSGS